MISQIRQKINRNLKVKQKIIAKQKANKNKAEIYKNTAHML